MSTAKTLRISSPSSDATEKIGESIGGYLRGGEMIELSGDVGGGKTTFTRGLARGAKSDDRVSSPTFTVSKHYQTPNFSIIHYDFYRLNDPGIMQMELAEAVQEPSNVIVVEWSDIVQDILPEKRLKIHLKHNGDESREVILTIPEEIDYLVKGLK